MSCVRESSPQSTHGVVSPRPESKRRRFQPFRNLRRIFRRKPSPEPEEVKPCVNILEPPSYDTSKSRSTSQLIDEPFTRRRSLHSTQLSVSHDSVFNPEQHSGQSDSESTVSVPQLGIPQANIQAELLAAVRRRRKIQEDDEEDLGLPRSPSMHSPTITTSNDLLLSKELINKSSHSTCSDGSLLSMGSSEMDEDSFGAHNSRYSSKISLHDKRLSQTPLDSSDGDCSISVPLSHDAAKHRMAIRPKRKHGNPRSKKPLAVTNALPATPEVNEEHSSGRSSASPETKPQTTDTADGTTIGTTNTTTFTTTTTSTTGTCTAVATDSADAIASPRDLDTSVEEISVENVPRREEGFFHRLLNRSAKKRLTPKSDSAEDVAGLDTFMFVEPLGAKPRQREEPPPAGRMQLSYPPDLPPDHQQQPHHRGAPTSAEDVFEPDTFVPIKQSFDLGQRTANAGSTDDDDGTCSSVGGGGSSVQKSSSSDSVSSAVALDEPAALIEPTAAERCRSYSSSDSEHHHGGGGGGYQRPLPVPAPRLSKLTNGTGGGGDTAVSDVVVRRRKRDDQQQQSELLKVFARRSLKLGKDGEPELFLVPSDRDRDVGGERENDEEVPVDAVVANEGVVLIMVDENEKNRKPEVDVNENQTADVVAPRFKRIQQRREEWEKRLAQKQWN